MSRKLTSKQVLAGVATAGVLGLGVAVPTMAFADDTSPSPSAASSDSEREQRHAQRQADFADALAKELGVPADKVTAAMEKLREQHMSQDRPQEGQADRQARLKERLDQAVADGKLTREQADAVLKAFEAGVLPAGPGGHGPGGHGPGGHGPDR